MLLTHIMFTRVLKVNSYSKISTSKQAAFEQEQGKQARVMSENRKTFRLSTHIAITHSVGAFDAGFSYRKHSRRPRSRRAYDMKFLQRKGNYNATNKQSISCCLLPMQWANGATKIARRQGVSVIGFSELRGAARPLTEGNRIKGG